MSEPLKPCPFCCGKPTMDDDRARRGTARQSCIVVCTECGCRHESGDEYEMSGSSWNTRAEPPAPRMPTQEEIAWAIHDGLGGDGWAYSNYGCDEWTNCREKLDAAADAILALLARGNGE